MNPSLSLNLFLRSNPLNPHRQRLAPGAQLRDLLSAIGRPIPWPRLNVRL